MTLRVFLLSAMISSAQSAWVVRQTWVVTLESLNRNLCPIRRTITCPTSKIILLTLTKRKSKSFRGISFTHSSLLKETWAGQRILSGYWWLACRQLSKRRNEYSTDPEKVGFLDFQSLLRLWFFFWLARTVSCSWSASSRMSYRGRAPG